MKRVKERRKRNGKDIKSIKQFTVMFAHKENERKERKREKSVHLSDICWCFRRCFPRIRDARERSVGFVELSALQTQKALRKHTHEIVHSICRGREVCRVEVFGRGHFFVTTLCVHGMK